MSGLSGDNNKPGSFYHSRQMRERGGIATLTGLNCRYEIWA